MGDTAPALAAHRIFYDNLKDVINKVVLLEDDIGRYQSTLKYARSTSDYSVGKGLFMLPSDMFLKPLSHVIVGYNDKIVINTSRFEVGKQPAVKHPAAQHEQKTVVRRDGDARCRTPHTLDDHRDELASVIFAVGGLTLFAI